MLLLVGTTKISEQIQQGSGMQKKGLQTGDLKSGSSGGSTPSGMHPSKSLISWPL